MNTLSVWCWVFNFNFNFFFKNPNQEKNNNKWYENLRYIKKCRNYPSCPLTEVLFLYFPIRSSIQVPFKFHSSFVSLLGTSQIFHLALHFIAGEGMKCFPCLADSFLICPGALGFPTSCTICGALAPNGPGASRYTLYDQHPRYSQTPAIYPARIKKIQMQLSWCYLPLSPDFLNWLFFLKWIIKNIKICSYWYHESLT